MWNLKSDIYDMEYKATIKGVAPSKPNCMKIVTINGHRCLAKNPARKKYEEAFIWQAGKLRDLNISEPFEFYIDVYYTSKRSDLDNVLKLQLDVLQRIKCIKNDNNCCLIHARKFIDKDNPRVEITIKTLE